MLSFTISHLYLTTTAASFRIAQTDVFSLIVTSSHLPSHPARQLSYSQDERQLHLLPHHQGYVNQVKQSALSSRPQSASEHLATFMANATLLEMVQSRTLRAKETSGEIPSMKLHETSKTLAFMDIQPLSLGHAVRSLPVSLSLSQHYSLSHLPHSPSPTPPFPSNIPFNHSNISLHS